MILTEHKGTFSLRFLRLLGMLNMILTEHLKINFFPPACLLGMLNMILTEHCYGVNYMDLLFARYAKYDID